MDISVEGLSSCISDAIDELASHWYFAPSNLSLADPCISPLRIPPRLNCRNRSMTLAHAGERMLCPQVTLPRSRFSFLSSS
jgi:hypothetical protein